ARSARRRGVQPYYAHLTSYQRQRTPPDTLGPRKRERERRYGLGEMGKETFLLLFVSGSAALAAWVAVCRPKLAPTSFRAGTVHLIAAVVVGGLLGPLVHAVPGLPARLSVLAAL